jgi:hypothetical protein
MFEIVFVVCMFLTIFFLFGRVIQGMFSLYSNGMDFQLHKPASRVVGQHICQF